MLSPSHHLETFDYDLVSIPLSVMYPARIAICDSFEQATQAQRDGCDAALVLNKSTLELYRTMERFKASGMAKIPNPVSYLFTHYAQRRLKKMTRASGFRRHNIGKREIERKTGSCGNHSDMANLDYIVIMSTKPTTVVFMDGSRKSLYSDTMEALKTVPGFSPVVGTAVCLFTPDGRRTIHHAIPDMFPAYLPRLCVTTARQKWYG